MLRLNSLAILVVAPAMALLPVPSFAMTRIVPDQFPTIQSAMAASASLGDTVLVRPGTYLEAVNYLGKDIVLKSIGGPEVTTIDASGRGSAAVYLQSVGSGARLQGFTIKKGSGSVNGPFAGGGGVHSSDAEGEGPIIEGNWITDNSAYWGGGVLAHGPVRVLRNRITYNSAFREGGGLWVTASDVGTLTQVISENEVFANRTAGGTNQTGGGLSVGSFCRTIITRNIVACNESNVGGGCWISGSSSGRVFEGNTIFANWGRAGVGGVHLHLRDSPLEFINNAVAFNLGGGIECYDLHGIGMVSECNDLFGNNPDIVGDECGEVIGVNGNIREDPEFGAVAGCPPAVGDLCLASGSPLLPENSPPGCGLIGARGLCGPIGIAEETHAPGVNASTLAAFPNPFAERTTLVIDVRGERVEHTVRILDARGRVVGERMLGELSTGPHRWVWDGHDDRGRVLPVGVYFAQVRAGRRELHTRVMILR